MTSSTDAQIQTTIVDEKSMIDEFTPTRSRETNGCVGVLDEITHEGLALCAIEKQVEEEKTKTIEDKSLDDIQTDDQDIVDSIEQASVDNPLQTATTITIQTPTYHIIECKICFESENTKCHLCICENSTGLCETCANQYLKSKIESSEYPIKCPFPDCRRLIPDATIEHNLDDHLKKVFVDLQAKATIELCPKCQEPKHRGLCTKNNKRFVKSVRKNGYKCCPKCYRWIEKNGGCNHMTCVCGNSFCYVCGDQSCRCHLKLAVVSRMRRRCTIM